MAQQTAVEWLVNQIHSEQYQYAFGQTYVSFVLIEQAKAMEKEQIIESNINGQKNPHFSLESRISKAEQYYNETYNK